MNATGVIRPTGLTVLYDAGCPVCRRARRWVERHRQLVPIRFVPAASELARRRFPTLDVGSTLVDVTVITDEGAVFRGDRAWIAVLWAVAPTRPLAIKLAHGAGSWRLHSVKSATEAIRSLSAGQHDRATGAPTDVWPWPPPSPQHGAGNVCAGCRA